MSRRMRYPEQYQSSVEYKRSLRRQNAILLQSTQQPKSLQQFYEETSMVSQTEMESSRVPNLDKLVELLNACEQYKTESN